MSVSALPLSYCTNVHPGQTVGEVKQGLNEVTVHVQHAVGEAVAAGLWLAAPVIAELLSRVDGTRRFLDWLWMRSLTCHTLNAFPYGDFHGTRVKETVYLPDWADIARTSYTCDCARVLAQLLPEGGEGSISTVPLAFKEFAHSPSHRLHCADQLLAVARFLERLYQETGRCIRLAIEPEPFCLLETTPETLDFFRLLRSRAAGGPAEADCRKYLGVCFDVCHQAVEFEDVAAAIRQLAAEEVRINKVHITCALELADPRDAAARAELAAYVEGRYLHQTLGRRSDGSLLRVVDLSRELAETPPAEWEAARPWRVHFHVPVDAESLGPLGTTRTDLKAALAEVARLDYAPHLEVETYTWQVLPGRSRSVAELKEGLTRELIATRQLLRALPAKETG